LTATAIEKADPEAINMLHEAMRQSRAGQTVDLEEVLKKLDQHRSA
jgi:hypothetical protein